MNTLFNALNESVKQQNTFNALKNCLINWDGSVDADSILQGVLVRAKALGMDLRAVQLRRSTIDNVSLASKKQNLEIFVTREHLANLPFQYITKAKKIKPENKQSFWFYSSVDDFFTEEEIEIFGEYLLEGFYH